MSIAEPLSLCHLVGWAVPATRSPVNQESQPQCFCLKVLQLKKKKKRRQNIILRPEQRRNKGKEGLLAEKRWRMMLLKGLYSRGW